jgi:N-acetylglucosaminyldiphosphoundecaprenol N-acetyl-beta-D-mannosaminyltransferase
MTFIKRVNILGCPFDAISFNETVETMRRAIRDGGLLQIVPGSVDFVIKAKKDPAFASELWRAGLVVADGVPITWAASLLQDPLRGRVSGTNLVWSCAELSADMNCTVAMIGSAADVSIRAAQRMKTAFPRASLHPLPTPFPLGEKENDHLIEQIRKLEAKIVLVALGAPKQERWVQANLERCEASVGIGVGSAFDIISGDKPRAPRWIQSAGLEWFQRMILEPKRLGRRYLIEDSPFLWHLAAELGRRRISDSNGGQA